MAGAWRAGSLLILDGAAVAWRPVTLEDVAPEDFGAVWSAAPGVCDFVLLGVGAVHRLPSRTVREALALHGLGLDSMTTENAARTHNILAAEGRRFATALIAV